MARIKKFIREDSGNYQPHPTSVECGYAVIQGDDELLLQLNTYGSGERAIPGKVSQTLQLDREQAVELGTLIEETFGATNAAGRVSLAAPDMKSHLTSLIGTTLHTLTGAPNQILSVEGDEVIVGTQKSPQGEPVPIADIQGAVDRLFRDGSVEISPRSVGYRSAFVGAVLASLPETTAETGPRRVIKEGN